MSGTQEAPGVAAASNLVMLAYQIRHGLTDLDAMLR